MHNYNKKLKIKHLIKLMQKIHFKKYKMYLNMDLQSYYQIVKINTINSLLIISNLHINKLSIKINISKNVFKVFIKNYIHYYK